MSIEKAEAELLEQMGRQFHRPITQSNQIGKVRNRTKENTKSIK